MEQQIYIGNYPGCGWYCKVGKKIRWCDSLGEAARTLALLF